jgi:hypothetical protein
MTSSSTHTNKEAESSTTEVSFINFMFHFNVLERSAKKASWHSKMRTWQPWLSYNVDYKRCTREVNTVIGYWLDSRVEL